VELIGRYSNKDRIIEKLLKTVQTACELTSSGQRVDAPSHRHLRRLVPAEEDALIENYRAGTDMGDVATKFGIHRTTVASILRRHQVPLRRQGLSVDQVALGSRLYGEGLSLVRVAERFGCDAETVRQAFIRAGVPVRPRK
jgi:DNA-directed RNA polymerase specialized sigma24 family protein